MEPSQWAIHIDKLGAVLSGRFNGLRTCWQTSTCWTHRWSQTSEPRATSRMEARPSCRQCASPRGSAPGQLQQPGGAPGSPPGNRPLEDLWRQSEQRRSPPRCKHTLWPHPWPPGGPAATQTPARMTWRHHCTWGKHGTIETPAEESGLLKGTRSDCSASPRRPGGRQPGPSLPRQPSASAHGPMAWRQRPAGPHRGSSARGNSLEGTPLSRGTVGQWVGLPVTTGESGQGRLQSHLARSLGDPLGPHIPGRR